MAGLHPGLVDARVALEQCPAVADPRRRHGQHAGAGDVGAPAQVEVVAVERHQLVEAAEGPEEVGADEHARRRHEEHVADGVVLLLIQLAGIDERRRRPELVGRRPDLEQVLGGVPVDDLRADDAGVGPVRLLHELADGVGVEGDVVVEQAEEPRALDEAEHLVGRRAEATRILEAAHERSGHAVTDPFGEVAALARVQEQDPQVGVVLDGQAVDDLVEPRAGIVGDDHGHDGWRGRRSFLHERSRVVAEPAPTTAPDVGPAAEVASPHGA